MVRSASGVTTIKNDGGNILSAGPQAVVRTNVLAIEATAKDVGSNSSRVHVELVQSANRPLHLIGVAGRDLYLNVTGRLREATATFVVPVEQLSAGRAVDTEGRAGDLIHINADSELVANALVDELRYAPVVDEERQAILG